MSNLLDRIKVILTAAPTYLVAAGVIATILLDELEQLGPLPAWVTTALTAVVTITGVAIAIIRRVTPVIPADRGVLPPPAPPRRLDA